MFDKTRLLVAPGRVARRRRRVCSSAAPLPGLRAAAAGLRAAAAPLRRCAEAEAWAALGPPCDASR